LEGFFVDGVVMVAYALWFKSWNPILKEECTRSLNVEMGSPIPLLSQCDSTLSTLSFFIEESGDPFRDTLLRLLGGLASSLRNGIIP